MKLEFKVKVSEIKSWKDFEKAMEVGAQYLGFKINLEFQTSDLIKILKKIKETEIEIDKKFKIIGIFKNQSLEEILEILNKLWKKDLSFDAIELQGEEGPKLCKMIKKYLNLEVWKKFSSENKKHLKKIDKISINLKNTKNNLKNLSLLQKTEKILTKNNISSISEIEIIEDLDKLIQLIEKAHNNRIKRLKKLKKLKDVKTLQDLKELRKEKKIIILDFNAHSLYDQQVLDLSKIKSLLNYQQA